MSMGSANDFELRVPEHFNFALDVIDRWAAEAPERVALWCVGEGGVEKKLTFGELEAASRRAAGFFSSMGLDARDRALILMPRLPQWWVAMLGLIRLGVVPIPCTTLLTPKDIDYRIQTAGVKAFLSDGEGASKFAEIAPAPEGIIRIAAGCDRPGWASFDAGVAQASPEFEGPRTRGDDPGIIYFTSATTGHPKMVLHTQASYGLGHRITGGLWLDLGPKDVCWNLSDTGWAKAAWSSFFGPWQMGSCIFAVDSRGKFDAGATLKTLASHPISVWCAPPTALRLVVREDLSAFRPGALRHCVSAGEPLNPEVISTWKNATGITIYEAYGQTETVCLIGNFRSTGRPVRVGSMGVPSPGFEIALLDAELQPVPDGQEGEIAIRVRPARPLAMFREYWRNPEQNASRFQGDWYLTGDSARRDEDGYFWFVGRCDDVIKSSGYRIGPFEVESALLEHQAVLESAVVGQADEVRGAIVKAFIVLRKGVTGSDELKREIQEHCKQVTAPYKYPREIEFVTELPKTISGKIRRVELRARKGK